MLPIEDQQSWIRGVGWNFGMVHGVSYTAKTLLF